MGSQFRDLTAYKLARALGRELHLSVQSWPRTERWSIGDQLVRAADSIGANIAEASGRWHPGDKRRLLFVARGSLHETEHWIDCALERGLLSDDFSEQLTEIGRTLNGLIRKPTPE